MGSGLDLDFRSNESALSIEYVVEQAFQYGGQTHMSYVTKHDQFGPGVTRPAARAAWMDCGRYPFLRLRLTVLEPQTATGRVTLRVRIVDGSECPVTNNGPRDFRQCGNGLADAEHYYHVVPGVLDEAGSVTLFTELRGEPTPPNSTQSPFVQRTDWYGAAGDGVLNRTVIVGVSVELVMDSAGVLNSNSSGQILLEDIVCTEVEGSPPLAPPLPPLSPGASLPPPPHPPLNPGEVLPSASSLSGGAGGSGAADPGLAHRVRTSYIFVGAFLLFLAGFFFTVAFRPFEKPMFEQAKYAPSPNADNPNKGGYSDRIRPENLGADVPAAAAATLPRSVSRFNRLKTAAKQSDQTGLISDQL